MDPSLHGRRSLIERISTLLLRAPEDREQLLGLLHSAFERNLLDSDALGIIEGALAVSDMTASDVMVPRAQMDVIELDAPLDRIVARAIETNHSRFPVIGASRDDVVGILLAKDLLRLVTGRESALGALLRPAVFVPESKRLNVLLREFRISRNHMAIVVDEYGGIAGLVTIEDVLEQIVGDIEDEFDFDEDTDNIRLDPSGRYRVKAGTEIGAFNEAFGTHFSDDDYDTLAGLILHELGRLPKRGEVIDLAGLRVTVLRADSRRLHTLLVDPPSAAVGMSEGAS